MWAGPCAAWWTSSDDPRHDLNARTPGGRLVHFSGDKALLGQFVDLKITGSSTWALFGELGGGIEQP